MESYSLDLINYFTLTKHHLTDDSKTNNIFQIVDDIFGLHATGPTTPYLSLFNRTKRFSKEDLDKELYLKRNLGKIRCVRKTIYILTKEMIPFAFRATNKFVEVTSDQYAKYLGVTQDEYKKTSKLILEALKDKAMSTKELKKNLKTKVNISPVVNLMCDQGLLIRGKSKQGWKSNIHTYHRFDEYFIDLNLNKIDEEEAIIKLIEKYIAAFGPVTETDIIWWAGLSKSAVRSALGSLKENIKEIEISEIGSKFLIISSDFKHLHSLKISKKPTINLLPFLDPYLMGYKERKRYLVSKLCQFVFDRSGNITSTVLLNGKIIGVWDYEEGNPPTVKILLFGKVGKNILNSIHELGNRIGEFISEGEVKVKKCSSITPLTKRTAGGFMTPLKER